MGADSSACEGNSTQIVGVADRSRLPPTRTWTNRDDVLSLMLQSRYEDGTAMSRSDLADELFTLLAAGHETTATQLAWAVERLRRHPDVLSRAWSMRSTAGGSDLLQATIHEVQRNRPVIDGAARQVIAPTMPLGEWVIPRGYTVQVDIPLTHQTRLPRIPDPETFDPDRFMDCRPGHVRMGALRRRNSALPRCRVREHGDERGAADAPA